MLENTRGRAILFLICGVLALAGGIITVVSSQQWWMVLLVAVGVYLIVRGILGFRTAGRAPEAGSNGS